MRSQSQHSCHHCDSRSLGVFCSLNNPALEEFDNHKTENKYKKGQIIFYEGNHAFGLFCILSGRIKLYKSGYDGRPQIVRLAGPGDLLGYRSLFADEPYHATAEALEDTLLCCIDKAAFYNVLKKNPELGFNILQKLSRELRVAEDLATSIAQKSVRERMAELLLMLQESYGSQQKLGVRINLQLSREEMAEMIGTTQETVIRLLSDFKREKLILLKDRDLTVLNPKALIEIAKLEV